MGEKRKPVSTVLLKKAGKTNKIEIFRAFDFPNTYDFKNRKYRLRINGRWWPKGERRFFYKSEIAWLLMKSIKKTL